MKLRSFITPNIRDEVSNNQDGSMELFHSFNKYDNDYIVVEELGCSMAKMDHDLSF
jgi:hypothetical protein